MIRGTTTLIAHLGYPTAWFKAPMIYNPYFEKEGIDAVVMPMGVPRRRTAEDVFAALFRLTNIRGALITMPHKVTTVALLDAASPAVEIAGACNAVLRRASGSLLGDMFDGAGFVRGVLHRGVRLRGGQGAGGRLRRSRLGDCRVAGGSRHRRRRSFRHRSVRRASAG